MGSRRRRFHDDNKRRGGIYRSVHSHHLSYFSLGYLSNLIFHWLVLELTPTTLPAYLQTVKGPPTGVGPESTTCSQFVLPRAAHGSHEQLISLTSSSFLSRAAHISPVLLDYNTKDCSLSLGKTQSHTTLVSP